MEKSEIEAQVRDYIMKTLGNTVDKAQNSEFIVAANWKMNMSSKETVDFLYKTKDIQVTDNIKPIIFPPFPYLLLFQKLLRYSSIAYGSQDIAKEDNGAFTGEVSGRMLSDCGCSYAIVGHSERRSYYGETSELVAEKAKAALKNDITPIICIGETLEERRGNRYKQVLYHQLYAVTSSLGKETLKCIIAYEPVWAIGTGVIPRMEEIEDTHRFIHEYLSSNVPGGGNIKLLYGGSVNEENVRDISKVAYVSGFLIGGASLKVDKYKAIIDILKAEYGNGHK